MWDLSCSWKGGRRLCKFCHQYLAVSAYYRHVNDKTGLICPGKSASTSTEIDELDETVEGVLSSSDDNISVTTESSFDFESSENQFSGNELVQDIDDMDSTQDGSCEADCSENISIVSDSSSEFDFQSDLEEEIWEDSGDDDVIDSTKLSCANSESHTQGENVILGISFF